MSWANTVIASCATILGFATSAVVAEVRHADHVASYIHISPAPARVFPQAGIFTRYRSLTSGAIGVASAAPDFQRKAVRVAGPSIHGPVVIR